MIFLNKPLLQKNGKTFNVIFWFIEMKVSLGLISWNKCFL